MTDLTTLGNSPISGDQPTGSDVRYEPEFEKLQTEIDKLSSPSAAGQVDWSHVEQYAVEILSSKSKDLTSACYLAVALVCNRQIEGLDAGLRVLKDLLETFWDNLYPPKKRMRGRSGAITWWLERTEVELQKLSPAPLPAEVLAQIKANLKGIDAVLSEKMPDAPVLRSLERLIDGLPVQQGEANDAPAGAAASAEPVFPDREGAVEKDDRPAPGGQKNVAGSVKVAPAVRPTGEEGISGAINSEAEARRGIDAALQRMRQVSLFLLQNDLKNPLAYRYRRIASWAKLTAPPPNTEGVTQIQAPAPQVIVALEAFQNEGNPQAVIQNAEQKLSQFIFWLDLNRWVAEALDDLGADYQNASMAVCRETTGLLERLPGLASLQFADGTPFADPRTTQWLQEIGSSTQGAGVSMPTVAAGRDEKEGAFGVKVEEARALAHKKKLIEAVELLQREMRRSLSQRQGMQWRLAMAQLLMEMKKTQLALPHLERVLADIDTYGLEVWEPDLALEGLMTAWQAFSVQADSEYKARGAQLLERVARVDAVAALRVAK